MALCAISQMDGKIVRELARNGRFECEMDGLKGTWVKPDSG